MPSLQRFLCFLICSLLALSFAEAGTISMVPFAGDHAIVASPVNMAGSSVPAWSTSPQLQQLDFRPSSALSSKSGVQFLKVTYLDKGYGRLRITFEDKTGQTRQPDKVTRVSLTDSGAWVTSYSRLDNLNDAGVNDVQLGLDGGSDNFLCISVVALQDSPFSDSHFLYLLEEDWKRPYSGESAPGIDNRTLKGKLIVGYQGWFRTPNDPYKQGWVHWGNMAKGEFNTDMWPDVSAYPFDALDKADDVRTLSGKPAYLFSPGWPEVVQTHFRWMREHQIDGAFVQRFLGGLYAVNGTPEWVLGNARAAANKEGRIWAIEYDVSGCPDAKLLQTLETDWKWLVDDFGIRGDPSYAHENGKPVVFIWGMGVPDRNISTATANAVVDFFKNDPKYGGNYVIGGITSQWRNMDSGWQDHFHRYEGILPWMSTSYRKDLVDFQKMGVDYYPHVWPGFSWANLKHLPSNSTEQYTPRDHGRFFEKLISQATGAGVDRLFVGMFDEYDESTAIMPMSDDPPPTPQRPGAILKFFPESGPGADEHAITKVRPQVKMAFDGNSLVPNIAPQNVNMRWEGQIIPTETGKFSFSVEGLEGDSWILWINGQKILTHDALNAGAPQEADAGISLSAREAMLYRLDYHHADANGELKMNWKTPSGISEEIPATDYVDGWGRFLKNEGDSADFWLGLTGQAKEMLSGAREPGEFSLPKREVDDR